MRPTAIVPLSGVGAWAVLRFAMLNGIKVPDELSIVSFDPVANSHILPIPLSGLTFSYLERAEQALEMLWQDGISPLHEVVRARLVPELSSGVPQTSLGLADTGRAALGKAENAKRRPKKTS